MAFSVNEIKSKLKFGGARPTLFQVTISSPFDSILGQIAPFFIQASTLPGSSIAPIEVPYFGRKIRVAGDRTFEPWSVTVMNDEDFAVRHSLETWHNKINSLVGNLNSTGAPSQYKVQAEIQQFSKIGGNAIRTYKFSGMFPTEISAIDVNWADTDAIEMFQVTFMYDYYEVLGPTGTVTG
jgi:hypothetical protein